MLNVSAMKTNNPLIIGGALLANVAISAAKPLVAIAYVGAAATVVAFNFVKAALPVVLRLLLAALFAAGVFAATHVKCIGLCAAVVAAVVVCFALPQVAVGVVCVLLFAEVTKSK